MRNKFILLSAAVLLLGASGCRSRQQVITSGVAHVTPAASPGDTLSAQSRLSALARGQLSWHTMQAGGNVKLGGSRSFSSGMQMRMIRDSVIYISLRPLLGIEAGKIVITRDSLLVVDKYHKRYIAEPTSLITNGIPVTVGTMQDIFLGRAFVLGQGSVNAENIHLAQLTPDGSQYRLTPVEQPQEFTYSFTIDGDGHLVSLDIAPAKSKQKTPYSATYADTRATQAGNIAHHAQVSANVGGKSFTLSLDLKNVTWNSEVKIDPSLPENYKRMDGKQITSILDKDKNKD